MEQYQHELQRLLDHLRGTHALGLDVLFKQLGQSGPYQTANLRYPLRDVDPLVLTVPGMASDQRSLADALARAIPEATTPDAALILLERFGGFVAATGENGQEVGGVSWFDQARLRLALDACGKQITVLRADVSGIQDFIYQAESEKALKSLRARSFYLELLAVHALHRMLELCGLTRANVAYLGGGGFQVYLPTDQSAAALAYAQQLDEWLWEEHQGTLSLMVAPVNIDRAAAESAEYQPALSAKLGAQKARKRQGRLMGIFGGQVFDPTARQEREERLADKLVEFGARLPRATHVEVTDVTSPEGDGWVTIHDRAYRPLKRGPATPPLRDAIVLNSLKDLHAFPMLSGNYVTRVQDVPTKLQISDQSAGVKSVATFEQLADLALGQPRLALFRCDADNMGTYFAGGIPGHNAARHATLSRLMSLFFQGYVNAICAQRQPLLPDIPQAERSPEESHGRYLNIIYSGGDDAIVVGAWNEVLTFAVDFRRAYREFTGGNANLGLSGGAFIAKSKYPLRRMAERAYEAEQLAKQVKEGKQIVKDGFVPFLTMDTPGDDPRAAVRWNVFAPLQSGDGIEHTLDVLSQFLTLQATGTSADGITLDVKRAFLWKLQAFAEREGDAWRIPLLHYALARATPPKERQAEWQALQRLLLQPKTWNHLGHVLGFLHLARPTAEERDTHTEEHA